MYLSWMLFRRSLSRFSLTLNGNFLKFPYRKVCSSKGICICIWLKNLLLWKWYVESDKETSHWKMSEGNNVHQTILASIRTLEFCLFSLRLVILKCGISDKPTSILISRTCSLLITYKFWNIYQRWLLFYFCFGSFHKYVSPTIIQNM